MAYNKEIERVCFDDTRFIFMTNFSGDPKRDNYGDSRRKVELIVPSQEQAKALTKAGIKVRETKPGPYDDPETFVPEYHVTVLVQYRKRDGEPVKYPPAVHLVVPGQPAVLMTEETVGTLDHIRVKNVNCVATIRDYMDRDGKPGRNLQTRTMYVEQDMDDDPYAEKYRRSNEMAPDEDF